MRIFAETLTLSCLNVARIPFKNELTFLATLVATGAPTEGARTDMLCDDYLVGRVLVSNEKMGLCLNLWSNLSSSHVAFCIPFIIFLIYTCIICYRYHREKKHEFDSLLVLTLEK